MSFRLGEWVLLLACAALVCTQVLIPPFIGLANNGDFPKVLGRFSLGPASGGWSDNFVYFVSDYVRAPQYSWDAELPSSEIWLASVAVGTSRMFGGAGKFDIRWLGAVHAILFITAFVVLLLALRNRGWVVQASIGLLCLLVFCDVRYMSQFNSCYTDTPALLGLGLGVAASLWILERQGKSTVAMAVIFTFAALMFICSKAQHGLYGVIPAGWLIVRKRGRLPGVILLGATVWIVGSTPVFYQGQALFNRIFFRILSSSPDRVSDAKELGVLESEFRYIGTHSFVPGSVVNDQRWLTGFRQRTGYGRLALFYLRHPSRTIGYMIEDLRLEAPQMRPENLSNFRKVDGQPPGAQTSRFALWTNLRRAALRAWPEHLIVWYAVLIAAGFYLARRSRAAAICLILAVVGILEFGVATLGDTLETARHLLVFHMITDLTICFAAAWGIQTWHERSRKPQVMLENAVLQ